MPERNDALKLFLIQRQDLIRYAANLTGDQAEAEDVVQEAWLRFATVAHRRFLAEPRGYLYRVVRNLALDSRRRLRREQQLVTDNAMELAMDIAADSPSAQAHAEAKSDLDRIRAILPSLPERTRIAFEMHRFEGIKLVEIATHLGISKSLAQELVIDAVERCKAALRRSWREIS